MKIDVITLFPRFFDNVFSESIPGRAVASGLTKIGIHYLRDYTTGKHQQADDYIYGGSPGMLLKPEPLFRLLGQLTNGIKPRPLVIFPTPHGKPFDQGEAHELARQQHLIFICGHYKGIDQRVINRWVDREYSLGDYVVTGGEIAVLAFVDATIRLIPGVLGNLDSALNDSFQSGLLDCPHYTRPDQFEGFKLPEVLLNGNHKQIEYWRACMSRLITGRKRPDLLKLK